MTPETSAILADAGSPHAAHMSHLSRLAVAMIGQAMTDLSSPGTDEAADALAWVKDESMKGFSLGVCCEILRIASGGITPSATWIRKQVEAGNYVGGRVSCRTRGPGNAERQLWDYYDVRDDL